MAAHQASPSLGFSRQEHWSGLPFPSPMHESEKWKWSHSVVSDSSDPMDCSLPGSSIHGIFQARVLEWGAIARFIHCCIWARFPCFLWLNYIYTYICIYLIRVCMPLTLFLSSHPWTDTGCFHVSATVNSAAVHTGEQYLFEIQILFLSDEYTHWGFPDHVIVLSILLCTPLVWQ